MKELNMGTGTGGGKQRPTKQPAQSPYAPTKKKSK